MAIRLLLIGCGNRSAAHLEAIREVGDLQLAGVCDLIAERAQATGEKWGVKWGTDAGQMMQELDVAAVSVVTTVEGHAPLALEALRLGKHVLVEKPLADSLSAAREVVEAHAASGLVGMVCFQLRFSPLFQTLHKLAQEVRPIQVLMERQRGPMRAQFMNPSPFCGVMDFTAHDFDIVNWIMGGQPQAVTASISRDVFARGTGAAEALSALIRYSAGDAGEQRSACIVSSIGAPEVGTRIDVIGTHGAVTVRPDGKSLRIGRGVLGEFGKTREVEDVTPEAEGKPDTRLYRLFAAAIRGEVKNPTPSLRDGLNSLAVSLACVRSAELGKTVSVGTTAAG